MENNIEIRKVVMDSYEYKEGFRMRNEILRKPRGKNLYQEELPHEKTSYHIVALKERKVIGVICWYKKGEYGIVKHLVVSEEARGAGIGKMLLERAESNMGEEKMKYSFLKARLTAKRFYEKMGYSAKGDVMESDIRHITMYKKLQV